MKIEDGLGTGKLVKVNSNHKLEVEAVTISEQHNIAIETQSTFQISGEITIGTSETTVITLKNTHSTKDVIITYIRVMSIGAAVSNASAYFNVKLGGEYASGGTAITSVNMYTDSPVTATVESYEGSGTAIVMGGTPVEIDRNYTANSMQSYGKEGSVIVPKNSSISITHKGSTVAGTAYARISYYME